MQQFVGLSDAYKGKKKKVSNSSAFSIPQHLCVPEQREFLGYLVF